MILCGSVDFIWAKLIQIINLHLLPHFKDTENHFAPRIRLVIKFCGWFHLCLPVSPIDWQFLNDAILPAAPEAAIDLILAHHTSLLSLSGRLTRHQHIYSSCYNLKLLQATHVRVQALEKSSDESQGALADQIIGQTEGKPLTAPIQGKINTQVNTVFLFTEHFQYFPIIMLPLHKR